MGVELVAVCLAGGLGASLRFVLDGAIRQHTRATIPLPTMIVNVAGSLLLGLLTGLVLGHVLSHHWQLVVGTGMMGGFTTFSTASVETVRLLEERRWVAGVVNGLGMLILCTVAAGLGYWLGTSL
jgi:fluoride exporter